MIDTALIQQCVDPGLKPAIVERFIAEAGSLDPHRSIRRRVVLDPEFRNGRLSTISSAF